MWAKWDRLAVDWGHRKSSARENAFSFFFLGRREICLSAGLRVLAAIHLSMDDLFVCILPFPHVTVA